MPVTYCVAAYEEVMTWTEKTRISYAPNKKSGKSCIRYGKYMKAKTVGDSLKLGSFGVDLLFDYEKGLLKPIGGPKRERPPDVIKASKEDIKKMSPTDVMLGKMYSKWKVWSKNFALMEEHGISRKELKEMNDAQDPEGSKDSIAVALGRRKAQDIARGILKAVEAEGRMVTDNEVLSCLRAWGFKENTNRTNVTPDGHSFVYSDTVGLIKMMTCETTLLTLGTRRYPEFTQVLTRWLTDRLPAELKDFVFTSININKNYAGRLHRDGNNVGPSLIKAFGDFTGGELNYWPSDNKKTPLEDFDDREKVTVNLKDNLLLFDGNRGHCVNPFEGERYSLVFFSVRSWAKAAAEEVKSASSCGIPIPNKATMASAAQLLGPTGKDGYRLLPQDQPKRGTKTKARSEPEAGPSAKRQRASKVPTPCRTR